MQKYLVLIILHTSCIMSMENTKQPRSILKKQEKTFEQWETIILHNEQTSSAKPTKHPTCFESFKSFLKSLLVPQEQRSNNKFMVHSQGNLGACAASLWAIRSENE